MFVSEFFQDLCMHAELPAWFSAESLAIKRPLIETLLLPCLPFSNIIANSVVEGLNFLVRSGFDDIVICFKNCSVFVRKRKKS